MRNQRKKQVNFLKRGKTRVTKSWLVLVLHLIGWESGTSFWIIIERSIAIPMLGYLSNFNLKLLYWEVTELNGCIDEFCWRIRLVLPTKPDLNLMPSVKRTHVIVYNIKNAMRTSAQIFASLCRMRPKEEGNNGNDGKQTGLWYRPVRFLYFYPRHRLHRKLHYR